MNSTYNGQPLAERALLPDCMLRRYARSQCGQAEEELIGAILTCDDKSFERYTILLREQVDEAARSGENPLSSALTELAELHDHAEHKLASLAIESSQITDCDLSQPAATKTVGLDDEADADIADARFVSHAHRDSTDNVLIVRPLMLDGKQTCGLHIQIGPPTPRLAPIYVDLADKLRDALTSPYEIVPLLRRLYQHSSGEALIQRVGRHRRDALCHEDSTIKAAWVEYGMKRGKTDAPPIVCHSCRVPVLRAALPGKRPLLADLDDGLGRWSVASELCYRASQAENAFLCQDEAKLVGFDLARFFAAEGCLLWATQPRADARSGALVGLELAGETPHRMAQYYCCTNAALDGTTGASCWAIALHHAGLYEASALRARARIEDKFLRAIEMCYTEARPRKDVEDAERCRLDHWISADAIELMRDALVDERGLFWTMWRRHMESARLAEASAQSSAERHEARRFSERTETVLALLRSFETSASGHGAAWIDLARPANADREQIVVQFRGDGQGRCDQARAGLHNVEFGETSDKEEWLAPPDAHWVLAPVLMDITRPSRLSVSAHKRNTRAQAEEVPTTTAREDLDDERLISWPAEENPNAVRRTFRRPKPNSTRPT